MSKDKEGSPHFNLLLDKDLFNKITIDEFNKKVVGEIKARRVLFLCAAGGRLVINSQVASYNILVNDDAGAGKDYVTNSVLSILPQETYIHKTRISPTVLTYWHNAENEPSWTWDGKVFYTEDISETVLNSDVFKVMSSSGSKATIVIKQRAVDITISGKPVMITTTAAAVPNPELIRRYIILNLDCSQNQTKAILKRHSEFREKGIIPEYNHDYTEALRLLKRVKVKIPFARLIDQYFPTENIIMRTHYPRFLDFISSSAAFHQYQRKKDNEGFILANGEDYDLARECFITITSNKFMIPLTINQKKIFETFMKDTTISGSCHELFTKYFTFFSERACLTNLQILTKYGILKTNIEKDSLNRDIDIYSLSDGFDISQTINIPKYNQLCSFASVSSTSTLTTISTISSTTPLCDCSIKKKTKKKGVTEDIEDIEAQKCLKEVTQETYDKFKREYENKIIAALLPDVVKTRYFKDWDDDIFDKCIEMSVEDRFLEYRGGCLIRIKEA